MQNLVRTDLLPAAVIARRMEKGAPDAPSGVLFVANERKHCCSAHGAPPRMLRELRPHYVYASDLASDLANALAIALSSPLASALARAIARHSVPAITRALALALVGDGPAFRIGHRRKQMIIYSASRESATQHERQQRDRRKCKYTSRESATGTRQRLHANQCRNSEGPKQPAETNQCMSSASKTEAEMATRKPTNTSVDPS
jgi:hypothetical protein